MGRTPEIWSQNVENLALTYIRPYHREIARRLVLGETAARICRSIGMGEGRMSIIVNSPLFKLEIKRLEDLRDGGVADVTQTLKELSPLALEVVERTMHGSKSETLRFSAAQDVLDRAGYGKTTKVLAQFAGNITHSTLSEAELRQLVLDRVQRIKDEAEQKARELREVDGTVITLEEVESDDVSGHENTGGKINVAFI